MSGIWRLAGDDLLLSVRLTPRATTDRIGGLWTDAAGQCWLSACVTAPPDKGRANAALLALLADTLALPKLSFSLEAGDTSRLKRIRIVQCDAATIAKIEEWT